MTNNITFNIPEKFEVNTETVVLGAIFTFGALGITYIMNRLPKETEKPTAKP